MAANDPRAKAHAKSNSTPNSGRNSAQSSQPESRWLLLTDFASKYRISVSTLRRRIKDGSQAYRFEGGRYYLPDLLGSHEEPSEAKSQGSPAAAAWAAPIEKPIEKPAGAPQTAAAVLAASMTANDEPLITTTSKLLNELKQAYTLILHEKEEQIVYLKEEIADLKTLIRVLESENARLVSDRERRLRETTDKGTYGNA